MMIELGTDDLDDFWDHWQRAGFREAFMACLDWAEKSGSLVDLVRDKNESFALQMTLRDSRGVYFTEPVPVRAGMDVGCRLSRAIVEARKGRIKKFAGRLAASRA